LVVGYSCSVPVVSSLLGDLLSSLLLSHDNSLLSLGIVELLGVVVDEVKASFSSDWSVSSTLKFRCIEVLVT
jgi:hypothetical protein